MNARLFKSMYEVQVAQEVDQQWIIRSLVVLDLFINSVVEFICEATKVAKYSSLHKARLHKFHLTFFFLFTAFLFYTVKIGQH